MPEGHVTHRAARLQGKRFIGRTVNVSSPQGRFAESAAKVDGGIVENITAIGKHLFYWFSTGDVVHVHLGLVGKFRLSAAPFAEASLNARLLLWTPEQQMQLTGPNTCELITQDNVNEVGERLGPDPIADGSRGLTLFAAELSKRRVPIGRSLLDQKVAAGLGNIFRSELLFLVGVHPKTPSKELSDNDVANLWQTTVAVLRAAEKRGRIVTLTAADASGPLSKLRAADSLYAYHRDGLECRRCSELIRKEKIDSRHIWWCPRCQPSSEERSAS